MMESMPLLYVMLAKNAKELTRRSQLKVLMDEERKGF
jgi:hypothetical protein